ncbi:MAG: helix-turn-helix domain-containing protein [Lachnospiraceae bacterium]|nr:helix-turn-helix domain-containing protein [Lachnospiraceae bacterium]
MEGLQILWVGRTPGIQNGGFKAHDHPYYHLFFLAEGKGRFEVGGEEYIIQAGQCLLVPRQVMHACVHEEQTDYLEIKFSLAQSAMDHKLMAMSPLVSDDPLAGALIYQILQEYSDLGNLADDAAVSYMKALLHVLTKQGRYDAKRQFRYVDASSCSTLSQQIVHYLEEHLSEDISLDRLAKHMDYNKSYLCAAFKKDTQLTIQDCLNTIRIRRAAELIVYSDHNLARVADLCGFASVSHFNRVFLKYVGATPGQCRRAYPVDISLQTSQETITPPEPSNHFMYSVLAQKRITPEMIRELDALEKGRGSEK